MDLSNRPDGSKTCEEIHDVNIDTRDVDEVVDGQSSSCAAEIMSVFMLTNFQNLVRGFTK